VLEGANHSFNGWEQHPLSPSVHLLVRAWLSLFLDRLGEIHFTLRPSLGKEFTYNHGPDPAAEGISARLDIISGVVFHWPPVGCIQVTT
jgi:hypothetical protein